MGEIWKTHEDYEDYEFSNHGRFRKADTKIILKNTVSYDTHRNRKDGYVITFLKNSKLNVRKRVRLHRMVGLLFVDNPNPTEFSVINHIDGNKVNNHHSNLEWTTVSQNNKHAALTGLRKTILDNDQTRLLRSEYISDDEITFGDLAQKYSVSKDFISSIVNYKTMTLVDEDKKDEYLELVRRKQKKQLELLTNKNYPIEDVNNILQDYVNGYKKIEILKKYNYSDTDIRNIIKKYELPTLTLLNNEIFKEYKNDYEISNMCRVKKNGLLKHKQDSFIIKAVGETFIEKPKHGDHIRLIDSSKPISIDNIEWCIKEKNGNCMSIPEYEILKEKFTTESITIDNFKIKYEVSKRIMSFIKKEVPKNLRPILKNIRVFKVKPHLCKKCGEDNPQNFDKQLKSLCKKCNYKYVKKPPRQHLCKKCGDNNPQNFNTGSKGCCRTCMHVPRVIKPHLCKTCGDNNPQNFQGSSKGKCKKCSYTPKPKKTCLCTLCGDNNPQNFRPPNKSVCNKCHYIKYKK
jgi:hypothetical protein